MSRWRPPTAAASPYVTAEGYKALEQELTDLWAKRRIVNDALAAAAAEGDRSENAEYQYRKKEQAGIDRRIRYLQKRMPGLTVVRQVADASRVFFGAWVELISEERQFSLRIVGADEINTENNWISVDSPAAKQLLRKNIGECVVLTIDGSRREWEIDSIRY